MVVATETATTTAGGGGDMTTAAVEGSLTKPPGGTPHHCLGGGCTLTVIVVTMLGARGCHQFATKCQKMPENSGKRRKMPENAGKCRKYRELAISLCGTKYLGGLKIPHPLFRTVEINRGPKFGGARPPFPPENIFSGFFLEELQVTQPTPD